LVAAVVVQLLTTLGVVKEEIAHLPDIILLVAVVAAAVVVLAKARRAVPVVVAKMITLQVARPFKYLHTDMATETTAVEDLTLTIQRLVAVVAAVLEVPEELVAYMQEAIQVTESHQA